MGWKDKVASKVWGAIMGKQKTTGTEVITKIKPTLAKGESKIRSSQMNKGKAPASANPEVKKKKAKRNAAGTMGQFTSGGKVKKMMGGGMAKKYKHGGSVKKCKVDGIAKRGRTRAARKK